MITTHLIVPDYYAFIRTSYCTYVRLTIDYVNTVQVLFTDYYELVYLLYVSFYVITVQVLFNSTARALIFTICYHINTVQVLFHDYYAFYCT